MRGAIIQSKMRRLGHAVVKKHPFPLLLRTSRSGLWNGADKLTSNADSAGTPIIDCVKEPSLK